MTGDLRPGGRRVLIVDDAAEIVTHLSSALEAAGHQVIGYAATWTEGVTVAAHGRPDVVLLDIHIPPGNGLDAVPALRQAVPWVRIIAFSADETAAARAHCQSAGVDGFVSKLSGPHAIIDAVSDRATLPW